MVRNMVARAPELGEQVLGLGGETLLRKAGRFDGSMDEAYGALRDLGLEAEIVQLDEEGKVVGGRMEFGSQPLKFNPVFEESDNVEQRMQENASSASSSFNF